MKLPKYIYHVSAVGATVGIIVILKDSVTGARYTNPLRIAGKTVVITGCTSGIGEVVAKDLANRGGRIIMGCRNMEKCEEVRQKIISDTYNTNVHCRKLDLSSLKSVRQFADEINKNERRVDILINNAAVMTDERSVTEDGFELHLGVNYLSQFLLTTLLTDKIVSCSPSRILLTTCPGYETSRIRFSDLNSEGTFRVEEAYTQSKLALSTFGYELATRLQDKGVTVNMVNTGYTQTNLRSQIAMNRSWISGVILKPIWYLMFRTAIQGAQTTIYSAVEPSIADCTGSLYSDCKEIPLDVKAKDVELRRRLWLTSELWTAERSSSAVMTNTASPGLAANDKTAVAAANSVDSSRNIFNSTVVSESVAKQSQQSL